MATITTTTDSELARVGVTLGSFSTDGPIVVERVHDDGSRWPMRSMSDVSGGAAFGFDYETPLSEPFHYEADNSGSTISSSPTTLTVAERALLTVPGIPIMGGPVMLLTRPEFTRPRPQAALDILGRETRIIKSDVLQAPQFALTLLTRSDEEANVLLATLAIAPVLLLRVPGTRVTSWCYVQTGEIGEVPVMRVLPPTMPIPGDITTWAAWSVPCEKVDAPVGGQVGDVSSSWQALKDTGMTWQQLKDLNLTWLEVLQGQAVV